MFGWFKKAVAVCAGCEEPFVQAYTRARHDSGVLRCAFGCSQPPWAGVRAGGEFFPLRFGVMGP